MKKLLACISSFLIFAGGFSLPTLALAQNASVAAACSTQTLPVGYNNGTLIITQAGDLCTSGSGGGGGGASFTAATGGIVAVTAGTNKPAAIDLFSSQSVLVKDTSGTAVDWTADVGVKNGATPFTVTVGAALPAGTALLGKVGIDQTTPGTTNATQEIAGTTGGTTSYHVIPGASDNHVVIKNGAGQIYSLDVTSIHTTYQYLRLYDAGTGFNGCNSASNIIGGWIIPGATTGSGAVKTFPVGRAFTNGLSICVTGAFTDTDTTAATNGVMSVNVGFK